MRRRQLLLLVAIGWGLTLAAGLPLQAGEAVLQLHGEWKRQGADRSLEQKLSLASEITSYGLSYDVTIPAGTPEGKCSSRQWIFSIKYVPLGMPAPIAANWYTQGFFALRLDDLSLHDIPITFRAVRTGGPDAMVEGTWATPKGPVYLRLAMRGGDDKLLMQVAMGPETKAEKLDLTLIAYPQGFEKPWDRHMVTATRDIPASSSVTLDPAQERWALYHDDRMRRERVGGGPCGLVYAPEEVAPVRVGLGDYAVTTQLVTKPNTRKITVGLWDFTSIADAEVMRAHLRRDGCLIAQDLAIVAAADWNQPLSAPRMSANYAAFLADIARGRLEPTAYDQMTGQIVTPHVAWAKPLSSGPLRTLVVAPRWNQRETVELAQRLDMACDTVAFCLAESLLDPELYLYNSYEVYGYQRKTEAAVLTDFSNKLQAERDVMVLSSFRPEIVPEHLRRRVVEKVRAGTGLVLLGAATKLVGDFGNELKPATWEGNVVPVDRLPVLDRMVGDKKPVWTAYTFGKGRVLVFNYPTGGSHAKLCLTPHLTIEAPDVLGYYDYYHSLLAAGLLWAAGRPMPVQLQFPSAAEVAVQADQAVPGAVVDVLVHDPARGFRQQTQQTLDLPQGKSTQKLPTIGLASGPRYTSVWIRKDGKVLGWGTGYDDLPAGPRIADIELKQAVAKPGNAIDGTVRLSDTPAKGSLEIELWDSYGRLLATQTVRPTGPQVPFQFKLPRTVAIVHEVRARLSDSGRLVDQQSEEFGVPDQVVDDYHFLAWCDGGNNAVTQGMLRVLADGGVDWIDNTGLTGATETTARLMVRNAARYGLRSIPYATRIHSDQMTGRVRQPCLTDPGYQEKWGEGLRNRAKGAAVFGPPAYTLGDENFLVSRAPLDVCTSPTCLAGFRQWLKQRYGTIEKLNASWQTQAKTWDDVMPATLDEVRDKPAHWPRWADHRLFMSTVFTQAHALGREAIRSVDPQARVGFDGLFTLDAWHGYDFYQLCRACDLVQVYAIHPAQLEYLRAWHQPNAIVGSWFNEIGNRNETSAKRLGWHLLFHNFNSSWYWTSYGTGPALLFPDLRPTPEFQWLQATQSEIMAGIGKLLLHAERQHDGIAIHYSQTSVYANTLLKRPMNSAQFLGFASLVEDLGLQYDVLSYEQIGKGKLKDYKVLVLPASTSLSPTEAEAIRKFVEAGGLLVADTVPAVVDDHCRLLEKGLLDDLLGIARSGLPNSKGAKPLAVDAEGLKAELPLTVYDVALKATTAKPWAAAGTTPAVLVNRAGSGWTVLLNTPIEQYTGLRKTGQGRSTQDLLRKLLVVTSVRPQVRVTAGEADVPACEIVRFQDGPIQYISLLTDNTCAGVKAEDVTIQLPRTAFVYDVRGKRALGEIQSVKTTLSPGDPKIYALMPYSIEGVKITPVAAKVAAGTEAAFDVALQVKAGTLSGRHCLRIEVLAPDGKRLRHYAQNVLSDKALVRVSVPLALNDPPGVWQVQVTDVATGRTASGEFTKE